ncbi:uncharacterized protein METZ01_LOCUS399875 [marine metagenome]|uniref:Uncharacterized protein n=1 Tax=marine metagenome TaxID=408172 RepID=A0A382VM91_9ZZZZ
MAIEARQGPKPATKCQQSLALRPNLATHLVSVATIENQAHKRKNQTLAMMANPKPEMARAVTAHPTNSGLSLDNK